MEYFKKLLLFSCFVVLLLFNLQAIAAPLNLGSTGDTNYTKTSEIVLTEAKENLSKFLNYIPDGYESFYGFNSRDDFKDAQVTAPIQIYTLSLDFLSSDLSKFTDYILPTNDWKIPVVVNGSAKSFLQVTKFNNSFKAVDLGGAVLASEIFDQLKFYNEKNDIYLFRLYQIASDLLLIVPKDKGISSAIVLPLNSAYRIREELSLQQNTTTDLNSLAPVLKKIYKTPFK
ncbi:MAG: hypothetical protein Q8903_14225 [Bacteroidota bacterium]|nr:hypothetical protein [Bacteroidota bacterium]